MGGSQRHRPGSADRRAHDRCGSARTAELPPCDAPQDSNLRPADWKVPGGASAGLAAHAERAEVDAVHGLEYLASDARREEIARTADCVGDPRSGVARDLDG